MTTTRKEETMETVKLTASVKTQDYDEFLKFMEETFGKGFSISLSDFAMDCLNEWGATSNIRLSDMRIVVNLLFTDLSMAAFFKLTYGSKMVFDKNTI